MAFGESILQTLAGLGEGLAKAKQQRAAEVQRQQQLDLQKQQILSQLATADNQRKLANRGMNIDEAMLKLAQAKPQGGAQHLQKSVYMNAQGEIEEGSFNPATGQYLDQEGKVVKDAKPANAGMLNPKRMQYIDPKTGKPAFGYQIMNRLFDDQMVPLPPGTEPYQRGLIGTTTDTTDPLTGLTTHSVRRPLLAPQPGYNTSREAVFKVPSQSEIDQPQILSSLQGRVNAFLSQNPSSKAVSAAENELSKLRPRLPQARQAQEGALQALRQYQKSNASSRLSPASRSGLAMSRVPSKGSQGALDSDGHIPESAKVNPYVREAANQLLDGTDKEKLPTKMREPAAALARRFGWEQGRFTPKEQVLLRESTTFLKQALTSPALKVLDRGLLSRVKLGRVIDTDSRSQSGHGIIGSALTAGASLSMDPQEASFVRTYNQLVGTISGLGQLVRSGRTTEATIARLMRELPHPLTTKDSADARSRIKRLLREVDVAMQKGSFEGDSGSGGGSKSRTVSGGGMTGTITVGGGP